MTPRTDAHALHDLLDKVMKQPQTAASTAWAEVLGCEYDTVDFVRRHGEVVSLLVNTLNQISALDDEATRERLLRYSRMWWWGVIGPHNAWNHSATSVFKIAQEELDHLASAADILAARAPGSALAPSNPDRLGNLRDVCKEWVGFVEQMHDLPGGLRLDLLKSLGHVLWLIDNVHLYGVTRVANAAQSTVGSVAVATRYVPARAQSSWREKTRALIVELGLLASLFNSGVDAVEHGEEFVSGFIDAVQGGDGGTTVAPKEIEPPKA